jgi:hypothetical protein
MGTLRVRLPRSLHKTVKKLVWEEGISMNRFIARAVSEKVWALFVGVYLEERARRGSRESFDIALAQVEDGEPDVWDRL